LCSAQRESAGVQKRGPISSQRNTFLQSTLIESAYLAPHFNPTLRAVHESELAKGHHHRATVEVAPAGAVSVGDRPTIFSATQQFAGRLRAAFSRHARSIQMKACLKHEFQPRISSAGEAEAGSGGDRPAKE